MEKYFNPKSKKIEPLFETLCPVFTVCCRTPDIVIGDKGASVSLNVEVCGKIVLEYIEEAKDKALLNPEFVKHIRMKNFDKDKHLVVYKPSGLYIIGRVEYNEGDPRL